MAVLARFLYDKAMKKDVAFYEWVSKDLLQGIPGIRSRAMFGGYGFYLRDAIFAIIADGRLYFKTAAADIEDFQRFKSKPFAYSSKDRGKVTMSYWELPEEIMEDREELLRWIKRAATVSTKKKR